jgi:hypothetical protein
VAQIICPHCDAFQQLASANVLGSRNLSTALLRSFVKGRVHHHVAVAVEVDDHDHDDSESSY